MEKKREKKSEFFSKSSSMSIKRPLLRAGQQRAANSKANGSPKGGASLPVCQFAETCVQDD